ncbi:MAG: glycosyltransferase family 39 protein [Candidatus Methanoperedens sp.]|nr:glycosyltransferase family 39 protein [Candidatus Methanoperedens nitroreducens]MDJ1420639.1 glycosyltransferase family 39 protein [Candidatus Methanoperedens sp.]
MYPDEGQYHWKVNKILVNNWVPVAEVFNYNPPFLQYIEAGVTLLFGGELNTLRMVSVIFGSLTIPFLYLFGKTMYNRKTGLLAAIFLTFSSYHILYSRTIMLETPTIFFITAFLYFFWLSQRCEHGTKGMIYAAVAGAMMGLSFDAKYMAGFLVPAVPAYILWTNKFNFKALINKKVLLIYLFAFLFVLPLLFSLFYTNVGFHGISYYVEGRFEKQTSTSNRALSIPIADLIIKTGEKIQEVLSWGAVTMTSPWKDIFSISAILLFIITLFYYLHGFIYREKKDSFLVISLIMVSILLLLSAAYKHYLLYLLPFYFIMLSNLAVTSFEHLRKENSYTNVFRILMLSLTTVVLLSYIVSGATSSYWDEGEYSWAKSSVEYIKNDVIRDGFEGEILIGKITLSGIVENAIYLGGLNAQSFTILKIGEKYSSKIAEVDLERVDILKPDYLIIDKDKYPFYFTPYVTEEIFKNYTIVFHSPTYPYGSIVFKKINKQQDGFSLITDGENGEISRDMFNKSVPMVMKVGEVYTLLVEVKNTGNTTIKFDVHVHSNGYIISVDDEWRNITLNKGSINMLKFKIAPYQEYRGKLPITVDLYARSEETGAYKKIDSSTGYVYLIEK